MFANEMVLNINMFGMEVIDGAMSECNIDLVISEENSNSHL